MSSLSFYSHGPYPYESAKGIILNLAVFNNATIARMLRDIGVVNQSLNFHCYEKNFLNCDLPFSRHNRPEDHFPSSYHPSKYVHRYCAECARNGYHSVFTFIPQVDGCLIHKCILDKLCERCIKAHKEITFALREGYQCKDCGFSIPSAIEQLEFRSDSRIRYLLFKHGNVQKNWFRSILAKSVEGDHLCKCMLNMTPNSFNEDLSMAVMSITQLANPFHPAPVWMRKPIQLHSWESNYADGLSPSEAEINDWEEIIRLACQIIESDYLRGHDRCLKKVEQIMSYSAEEKYIYPLCPLAIAYAFFRARLNFKGGWDGCCDQFSELRFDYIKNAARTRPWLLGCREDFFIIFFLKLLGAIKQVLDGNSSQHIALGLADGLLDELFRGYSEEKGRGVTFVRRFDFCDLECESKEIYRYAIESECFFVREMGRRTYLILNKDFETTPFASIRV